MREDSASCARAAAGSAAISRTKKVLRAKRSGNVTDASSSHVRIIGSAPAFGDDPDDILLRVFDVAGFAVDAILRVDLKPGIGPGIVAHDLVYAGRAVALLGRRIKREIVLDRNRGVLEAE